MDNIQRITASRTERIKQLEDQVVMLKQQLAQNGLYSDKEEDEIFLAGYEEALDTLGVSDAQLLFNLEQESYKR